MLFLILGYKTHCSFHLAPPPFFSPPSFLPNTLAQLTHSGEASCHIMNSLMEKPTWQGTEVSCQQTQKWSWKQILWPQSSLQLTTAQPTAGLKPRERSWAKTTLLNCSQISDPHMRLYQTMFIVLNCWFWSNSISSNNLCTPHNCSSLLLTEPWFSRCLGDPYVQGRWFFIAIHNQNRALKKKKSHNLIKQFWKLPSSWAVTGLQYEYLTCFDQIKEDRTEPHFTNKKI